MADNVGMFEKTKTFLGDVRIEMTKVVWPTPDQVKTYTTVVLTSVIIIAVLMGLWDQVLGWTMRLIFGAGAGES